MQAKKTTLMSLIGENYKQFKVPIYQRPYDWKKEHCLKLIQDIFDTNSKQKEHFTGTVVYLNDTNFSSEKTALLIDGQQRVTTILIFLKALSEIEKKYEKDIISKQIREKFLYSDTSDFEKKVFKLIPTEDDQIEYEHLMNDRFELMNQNGGFYVNFHTIKNVLESKILSHEELKKYYSSLNNYITIIELVLDKGIDDPQEIFESINSTGLELSQADLIRNFLLMSVHQQDLLYKNYWKPLVNTIGAEQLEDFMFNFLLFKVQKKLNVNEIYQAFVELFNEQSYTREGILKELVNISYIYKSFFYSTKYSPLINKYLTMFREIDQATMYPFFIKVFLDFESSLLDENSLANILKFFLNYHVRRLVVGASSSSLRGLYINLYTRIFKLENNKKRYFDSIATYISDLRTKDEVPSDNNFLKHLQTNISKVPLKCLQKWDIWSFGCISIEIFLYF
jgi:uncharacterized protein with ParB-like and HNH nuclease domain